MTIRQLTSKRDWAARRVSALVVAAVVFLTACDGDSGSPCCDSLPQNGLYATFELGNEQFHTSITSADGMARAQALWAGTSAAGIVTGHLICKPTVWNSPWSWYLDPPSVSFAEVTIEACQATPGYIESNCATFAAINGQYCAAGAHMTALRDCNADPTCPPVPH
jgi:hypothetical protein